MGAKSKGLVQGCTASCWIMAVDRLTEIILSEDAHSTWSQ